MKTINATLQASQKLPSGRGYALASLADNNRLHPTQTVTSSYSGGKVIGVACASFYVRIRYKAAGSGTLEYQKITDPTVSAQWTTWTALVATNVFSGKSLGVFWTGTYAVVVWQDTPTGDVKYKRSSDGTTWGGTGVVTTALLSEASAAGVSFGSTTSGIMRGYAAQLYWCKYNDSADTWTAAESAGATFTTSAPEIAAFCDTVNSRYIVAVAVQGWASYLASFAIVAYNRLTGSATWSAGQSLVGGSGSTGSFLGLGFAQRQINGYWWLSYYRFRLWNVNTISTYLIAASNDGLFFDDALPSGIAGNEATLSILPAPSAGTWSSAYLVMESAIYRNDAYTYWSNAAVLAHHFITAHGGHQEGGSANGRGGAAPNEPSRQAKLTALIDNRSQALATPRLFSVLTLTRGLEIAGVQRGQSAGAWYITGFRYMAGDNFLEVIATDASGLLSSWFSESAITLRGQTVRFLVERICALAGVHTVSFDATAAWTDTVNSFTHPVGENAVSSLKSLAERVPFEYIPQEDGSLSFYVPTASPAAVYTFGVNGSDHNAWLSGAPVGSVGQNAINPLETPPFFGQSESITYLQDIGSPARNRVGEAIDQTQLTATGRRRSLVNNDRRLTTDAQATAAGNALLVSGQERKRAGLFEAPPAFNIEPGDVISISGGSAYAAANGPWRIEQIEEHFNHAGARAFFQRITLRGTA